MNNNYMIEKINIGGFRSYSTKWGGQNISYKRINLFIGPNNSGKSNIIKFIQTLEEHYNNPNTFLKEEDVHLKEIDNNDTYGTISLYNGNIIATAQNKQLLITNSRDDDIDIKGFFEQGIFYIYADRSHKDYDLKVLFSKIIEKDKFIKKTEEWLKIILDESVKLEWNDYEHPTELIFNLYPTTKDLTQTINDLGTGVQQVLKILTYIYIKVEFVKANKVEGINIFIEEPEVNLHAKAVISLVKILSIDDYLKECRFFITTHSNAFIDQANDEWTISSLEINGERNTELKLCIDNSDKFKILDSLGIKASQLMQTNIVIWIEGPSDRLYIKKWLDLVSKGNFIEGKHYSFMMYGGSLLAHLSANVEIENSLEEFVDILSTSNYAIVVIDKDRSSNSTEDALKNRVKALKARILEKKVQDRVEILLTNGREIENFVPKKLILNVLQTFNRDNVSYHNSSNKKITINFKRYSAPIPREFRFTKNDNFNVSYAKWLLTNKILIDYGIKENDKTYNNLINNLKKISKVEFAKRIIQKFKIEDIDDGLEKWLEIIMKKIENANR